MGRTLKRVPLDFDWPVNKIWEGYLNPYYGEDCPSCNGEGYSTAYRKLKDRWYGYDCEPLWIWIDESQTRRYNIHAWCNTIDEEDVTALIEGGRLWDFVRVARNEEQRKVIEEQRMNGGSRYWLPFNNGYVPTPDEVNLWNRDGLGHDSINTHLIIKARLSKTNEPTQCSLCQGNGTIWESEEQEKLCNEWEASEPPLGEGYQLWETTTEGSPQSPVYKTLDTLCFWCAEHATTFGSQRALAQAWKEMLKEDFVRHEDANGNVFL